MCPHQTLASDHRDFRHCASRRKLSTARRGGELVPGRHQRCRRSTSLYLLQIDVAAEPAQPVSWAPAHWPNTLCAFEWELQTTLPSTDREIDIDQILPHCTPLSGKPSGDARASETLGSALTVCVLQQVYCWMGHFLFLPPRGRGLRPLHDTNGSESRKHSRFDGD